jgi:thiosulfate dehydrogenase (quinone) large subunit
MYALGTTRIRAKTWPGQNVNTADSTRGAEADSTVAPAATSLERPARWGMAVVYLLLAYEWLLSGFDKIFSSDFRSGLAGELQDAIPDIQYGWYVHFLEQTVIPHARGFAVVIEVSEVLVALGLLLGAALWIGGDRIGGQWSRMLRPWVIVALLGSAIMTANYYLMAGNSYPWFQSSAPFDEGLSIDGLMTLVAIGLIGIELLAMRVPKAGTARLEQKTSEVIPA